MGSKLTKKQLTKACEKHKIEVTENTTCAEMAKLLNNYYGKQLYNYSEHGAYIRTNSQRIIVSHDVNARKYTTTLVNCPICKKDLPISNFKNLSNNKMKYCKNCRQEMGRK